MSLLGHTSCWPGKKVRLILRDGTVVISKFVKTGRTYIELESGKYKIDQVRKFLIFKPLKYEM